MPIPMRQAGVSTTVKVSPCVSVSDSLKVILPGMSISNRCTCTAVIAPSIARFITETQQEV